MSSPIRLVALDMAGTTISDDGVVLDAFHEALADANIMAGSPAFAAAQQIVQETMGRSKIEVFRRVLGAEPAAARATTVFETAYEQAVRGGRVHAISGAQTLLGLLRADGIKTCLTTGFSPVTRDLLLKQLGWEQAADLVLSPADAGRGRPHPDLLWTAMLRCGALTGADDDARLRAGGATHILPSVADLLALLVPLRRVNSGAGACAGSTCRATMRR
ncbi:MAG TPA: HAD family hydrolase [Frankiaceae bacterium]|jgi:phosphonatase-like hydrolase|nr:HAD family hydrolase [Frankiaceae bacterium]